jgi:hypothetical protein
MKILYRHNLIIFALKQIRIQKRDHRCTRVEIPGEGVPDAKTLGGQGFQEKLPGGRGVPLFRVLLHF